MALVAIGIGSNLGERAQNIRQALDRMQAYARVMKCSSLYETEAVGIARAPAFLNCACTIETQLEPPALLCNLKQTELEGGRRPRSRNEGWESRPIDLDILLYELAVVNEHDLVIPHPLMLQRRFVLVPLAEIASAWVHPIVGFPIAVLASQLIG
jgi:2-amino-4-hydroxy-6-hydroxymethyldihydropteridine diphosphokinase